MKPLAKIFFASIFLVFVSACERKSCNNVVCPANQSCFNGQCYCADGLEGTNCQTYSYTKYVDNNRSWYVNESCSGASSNFPSYTCFFTQYSSNPSEIQINNFLGGNCTAYAYIRTDQSNQGNIIDIPSQNCGGITVSGQGTYYSNNHRIIFQLNYTFNFASYSCTHTFY